MSGEVPAKDQERDGIVQISSTRNDDDCTIIINMMVGAFKNKKYLILCIVGNEAWLACQRIGRKDSNSKSI